MDVSITGKEKSSINLNEVSKKYENTLQQVRLNINSVLKRTSLDTSFNDLVKLMKGGESDEERDSTDDFHIDKKYISSQDKNVESTQHGQTNTCSDEIYTKKKTKSHELLQSIKLDNTAHLRNENLENNVNIRQNFDDNRKKVKKKRKLENAEGDNDSKLLVTDRECENEVHESSTDNKKQKNKGNYLAYLEIYEGKDNKSQNNHETNQSLEAIGTHDQFSGGIFVRKKKKCSEIYESCEVQNQVQVHKQNIKNDNEKGKKKRNEIQTNEAQQNSESINSKKVKKRKQSEKNENFDDVKERKDKQHDIIETVTARTKQMSSETNEFKEFVNAIPSNPVKYTVNEASLHQKKNKRRFGGSDSNTDSDEKEHKEKLRKSILKSTIESFDEALKSRDSDLDIPFQPEVNNYNENRDSKICKVDEEHELNDTNIKKKKAINSENRLAGFEKYNGNKVTNGDSDSTEKKLNGGNKQTKEINKNEASIPTVLKKLYQISDIKQLPDYKTISQILQDGIPDKMKTRKNEVNFWNTYSYLADEMVVCIQRGDWKSFTEFLMLFADAPKMYESFTLKACIINFIYNPISNPEMLKSFLQQCIPCVDESEISETLTTLFHVSDLNENET